MSILINEQNIKKFKENLSTEKLQGKLYRILKKRVLKNTKENRLVQSNDATQEWYHLVWERMSDASFLYYMEKDEVLGRWLHDRTMEIANLPADDWIGPWYRERNENYQVGSLETAHIVLAVCEAYVNAGELFSENEKLLIREAIKDKGMIPCKRFIDYRVANQTTEIMNNWLFVILDGYGTAALVLNETENIEYIMQMEQLLCNMFNHDSYGESVQYSNYTSLHLSHLHEVLLNSGAVSQKELHSDTYMRLMPWYTYSFLHMKYADCLDAKLPRTFAFGDSSNLFRPTADVLVRTAVWGKEEYSIEAGLAAWLFQTIYTEENGLLDGLGTFGFINQFQYNSLLLMNEMTTAVSPAKAYLPLLKRFETGEIIARDSWENTQVAIAILAGHEPLCVTSHRHRDQNSFQLSINKERMLIDPGHCCYRLEAQKHSLDERSHNTIGILYKDKRVKQKIIENVNCFRGACVSNELIALEEINGVTIVISDATKLYEDPIKKVIRIWVFCLPDIIWVIDEVIADEPVRLITNFVANNKDNCLEADLFVENQITLKRKEAELKIEVVSNEVDQKAEAIDMKFDWTYLHDYYHPLPNQAGQGKEGSGLVYVFEDSREGLIHRRISKLIPNTEKNHEWEKRVHFTWEDDCFVVSVDDEKRKFFLES